MIAASPAPQPSGIAAFPAAASAFTAAADALVVLPNADQTPDNMATAALDHAARGMELIADHAAADAPGSTAAYVALDNALEGSRTLGSATGFSAFPVAQALYNAAAAELIAYGEG